MPKSASTFMSNAIAEITGFRKVDLVPAYGRREQELCENQLWLNENIDYVAQQHLRSSQYSSLMCDKHNISVIVLIRSLFDITVSLRDHIRREGYVNSILYLDKSHLGLDDRTLELLIVKLGIPWYISFYMGWRQSPDAKLVQYEDFTADPTKVLREVLQFARVPLESRQRIEAGVQQVNEKKTTRLNVGVGGRGAQLAPETVGAILEMLDFYPEIARDRYVLRMKEQAAQIMAAHARPIAGASANNPGLKRATPESLHRRALGWIKHRAQAQARWGRSRSRVLGVILIVAALLYFFLLGDMIPDKNFWGRVDDIAVPVLLSYAAGRFLTRRNAKIAYQRARQGRLHVESR